MVPGRSSRSSLRPRNVAVLKRALELHCDFRFLGAGPADWDLAGFFLLNTITARGDERGGLFFSPSAVIFLVDFSEARVGDVGVDLGRLNRGVAEHRLDAADVGAMHQ